MVGTLLVLVAVNLIGYLVIYLLLKERIRRAASPASEIDALRQEVNRLIIELNQTTDRNIGLIEDRIAGLVDLLSKADKKIGLLRREGERREVGAQVYARVVEAAMGPRASVEPPEAERKPEAESRDLRERVVALYRAGFSAPLIAGRVGAPLGEVELIISLEQRKGSA